MIAHGQMWDAGFTCMPCGTMSIRATTDKQSIFHFFCHLFWGIVSCRGSDMRRDTWQENVHTNLGQKRSVDDPGWVIFLLKQSHSNCFQLISSQLIDSELQHRFQYMLRHFYTFSWESRIRVGTLAHLLSPLVVRRDLHSERRWNADCADLNINVVR